jgi:lysozyme
MRLDQSGLDFIKKWEGFRSQMYRDVAGHYTIGWGHLMTPEEVKIYKKGIHPSVAEILLVRDVRDAEEAVTDLVAQPLSQNQFNALVSFTYNLGRSSLARSTLLKAVNNGDFIAVPDQFKKWVNAKVNGKIQKVRGLVRRREEEAALFQKEENGNRHD